MNDSLILASWGISLCGAALMLLVITMADSLRTRVEKICAVIAYLLSLAAMTCGFLSVLGVGQ